METTANGLVRAQNYIFGEFESCDDEIVSVNPCTGNAWAVLPDSGQESVNRAVYAAVSAFRPWADWGYAKRAHYLLKVNLEYSEHVL